MSIDEFRHPHLAKDYYSNGQVPGEGGLPVKGAPAEGVPLEVAPNFEEQPQTPTTSAPLAPVKPVEAANGAPPAPEARVLSNAEISNLLTDNGIEHNPRGNKAYLTDIATQAGLSVTVEPAQPADAA